MKGYSRLFSPIFAKFKVNLRFLFLNSRIFCETPVSSMPKLQNPTIFRKFREKTQNSTVFVFLNSRISLLGEKSLLFPITFFSILVKKKACKAKAAADPWAVHFDAVCLLYKNVLGIRIEMD